MSAPTPKYASVRDITRSTSELLLPPRRPAQPDACDGAELLAKLGVLTPGDLRYVPALKLWLFWNGSHWQPDHSESWAYAGVVRVAEHYYSEAARLRDEAANLDPRIVYGRQRRLEDARGFERAAKRFRNLAGIRKLLRLARTTRGIELGVRDMVGMLRSPGERMAVQS